MRTFFDLPRTVQAIVTAALCTTIAQTASAAPPEPVYKNGAVAADHALASEAGVEMLKRGGNAVDAAVATSFCLSVVRPYSCGIGGGGFMVIYTPAADDDSEPTAVALGYREMAPKAVDRDYYVKLDDRSASRFGHHASGVPGTVAGLFYALEHYGSLDRATVLGPAIRAAEEGFVVDANHVSVARDVGRRLDEYPHLQPSFAYLWETLCHNGNIEVGDTVRNPQQGRALRLIAEHGRDAFYTGEIAQAIEEVMREHDGSITAEDLAAYEPRVAEPQRGSFREYRVVSMPPPSSGGIAMQQIFGMIERIGVGTDGHGSGHNSPEYVHLVTEAMKYAFADRAEWLADSEYVNVPVDRLLNPAYLDQLAREIDADRTFDMDHYGSLAPPPEDAGTSHFSVVDGHGMAVACTETINLSYGSLVCVPGFGFALNDQMDDFTTFPGEPNAFGLQQSDRNAPEPGKRPLSSMSPTIVVRDGRVVLVAGASGGPRIITGTTQCILNCLLFDMTPRESLTALRFHHQWLPNAIELEGGWIDTAGVEALNQKGHEVREARGVGVVQLISVSDEGLRAASDPRKGGRPAGY